MTGKAIKRLILFLAVSLGGAFLAYRFVYPFVETGRFYHSVLGIDLSHHQGAVDWTQLKAYGVDFAYIKASEGENFNDPRFSRNWYAAEQAGILRGAYHFFTQCRSGRIQAQNFIRVVPKDPGALPPVIDAEHMGPCRTVPAVKDIAAEMTVFLKKLQAHYGKRPIIYTTRAFHDKYLKGKFAKNRFWVRSLILTPRFRKKDWVFWQYHNRGRRPGINGPVDLNAFRGTRAELNAL